MTRLTSQPSPDCRRRGVCLAAAVILAVCAATPAPAQPLTPAERDQIDSGARGGPRGHRSAKRVDRHRARRRDRLRAGVRRRAHRPQDAGHAVDALRHRVGQQAVHRDGVLLLAEEGKLSLDDKVAKWFPTLTRANDISVRQLLSMTSGYQDYWPQDYVFPDMQRPATAQTIMQRWAGKPLDFDPGTKWQYSNTNYVIAAAIVERVAGMAFMDFLRQRIFTPLQMTSVADFDAGAARRHAMRGRTCEMRSGRSGRRRRKGPGWLFGAGQLAMTAHDLALWNIAVINRSVLRPASYKTQQTDVLLEAGNATGYGLGVSIGAPGGRRRIVARRRGVGVHHQQPDLSRRPRRDRGVHQHLSGRRRGARADRRAHRERHLCAGRDRGRQPRASRRAGSMTGCRRERSIARCSRRRPTRTSPRRCCRTTRRASRRWGRRPSSPPTGESLRGGMTIRSYRIRAGGVHAWT